MVSNAERGGAAPPDAVRPDAALHRHRKRPRGVCPLRPGARLGGIAAPRNRRRRARPALRGSVSTGTARVLPLEPLPPLKEPNYRGRLLRGTLCAGAARCGDHLRRPGELLAEVLRSPGCTAGSPTAGWRTSVWRTGSATTRCMTTSCG